MARPTHIEEKFNVLLTEIYNLDTKLAQIQYDLEELKEPQLPRYLTEPMLNSLDDVRGGESSMATKKLDIPAFDEYPEWKRQLWKATRVFVAAFLGVVIYDVQKRCTLDEVDVCITQYWSAELWGTLVSAGWAGGIAAIANWWRTDQPYNSLAHKSIV